MIVALICFFIFLIIGSFLVSDFVQPISGMSGFYKFSTSIAVFLVISIPGFIIGRLSGAGSGWHEIALIYRKRGVMYHSPKDII